MPHSVELASTLYSLNLAKAPAISIAGAFEEQTDEQIQPTRRMINNQILRRKSVGSWGLGESFCERLKSILGKISIERPDLGGLSHKALIGCFSEVGLDRDL